MQPQQQQQQIQTYPGLNGLGAPPPGVIYVPVPVRRTSYEGYANKQSIGLGITQIIIGVLCIIFNLVILLTADDDGLGSAGHGFWCGGLFIVTGSLGIAAGMKKQKCQIVSFMVMCIISAIFTISLLTIASVGAAVENSDCNYYGYGYDDYYYYPNYYSPCYKMSNYEVVVAMESLMAVLAVIEAIVAIWGSALCCKAGACCCSRTVQTAAIPANQLSYNGQVIYLNQTQGAQGPPYMNHPINTYQLGMIGPPLYTPNYVQPQWTMPPQMLPQVQPPAFVNTAMTQEPPVYSHYDNVNDPTKF